MDEESERGAFGSMIVAFLSLRVQVCVCVRAVHVKIEVLVSLYHQPACYV